MRNIDRAAAVVAEAREWVGTPYQHQARLKHVGCDCAGLIIGVGLAVGVLDFTERRFAPWRGYGRLPNPTAMRAALETFMVELPEGEREPGDVAWFEWRDGLPMHLAIIGQDDGRLTVIHSTMQIGRVVEHGFEPPWPDRVASCWRFPGVIDGSILSPPTPFTVARNITRIGG